MERIDMVGLDIAKSVFQDLAAQSGYKHVVELLLANNAEVEARDIHGGTSLHFAAIMGHRDVAALLITNGADVNARSNTGQTPLHVVALKIEAQGIGRLGTEHKAVAELLLANGADANAKDLNGLTATEWAVRRGHRDIVELLNRAKHTVSTRTTGALPAQLAPIESYR